MSSAFGVLDKNIRYRLKIKFLKQKEFFFTMKEGRSVNFDDLFFNFFCLCYLIISGSFFAFILHFCIVYCFYWQVP